MRMGITAAAGPMRKKCAWDEAIADYTGVIRLDPKNADAYAGRGYAHAMKGDQGKAIADYNEAIRLNPKFADAYYDRGSAYVEKRGAGKALADYTEAIRLDAKNANAYAGRGYALHKERRPRQGHRRLHGGHPARPEKR